MIIINVWFVVGGALRICPLWIFFIFMRSFRLMVKSVGVMALILLALCYYSARAGANLVSLGYLQESGVSYASVRTSQLRVSDVDCAVLHVGTTKDNRLTPVSMALVQASAFLPPSLPPVVVPALPWLLRSMLTRLRIPCHLVLIPI